MAEFNQQKILAWNSQVLVEDDLEVQPVSLGGLHRTGKNYKPVKEEVVLKQREKNTLYRSQKTLAPSRRENSGIESTESYKFSHVKKNSKLRNLTLHRPSTLERDGNSETTAVKDSRVAQDKNPLLSKYKVSAWHTLGPEKTKSTEGGIEAGGLHRIGKNYKPHSVNVVSKDNDCNPKKPLLRNESPRVEISNWYKLGAENEVNDSEVGSGQLHRQGNNFKPHNVEPNRGRERMRNQPIPTSNQTGQRAKNIKSSPNAFQEQSKAQEVSEFIDCFSELSVDGTERECTLFNDDVHGVEFWDIPVEENNKEKCATKQDFTVNLSQELEETISLPSELKRADQIENLEKGCISECTSPATLDDFSLSIPGSCQGNIILLLEIEIHDGRTKTIALHEHDNPLEVAKRFCQTWDIPGRDVVARLARLITLRKAQISTL